MTKYELRERCFKFSVDLVKFLNNLAKSTASSVLFNQVIRSGTSIGANVEEADNSPTRKDFKYKMVIAKKEAAETVYWLRIIIEAKILKNPTNVTKAEELLDESNQLLKIISSIFRKI
ncbi:four helix bundle protein [Candidatus Margulisiibacteriota bacterium]